MGTWFVIAVKPTFAETTCSNAVEKYTLLDETKDSHDIDIDFTYNPKEDPYETKNKVKSLPQKGMDSREWSYHQWGLESITIMAH